MKTIENIKSDMNSNIKHSQEAGISTRTYNSLVNKNKYLYSILLYLETNPKKSFIQSEVSRLEKLIGSKESQYSKWSKDVCPPEVEVKKRKPMFNRELGIDVLKKQLKTNLFILQ